MKLKKIALLLSCCIFSLSVLARSINGYWQTISDKTGHAVSVVKIWKARDLRKSAQAQYYGKIIKIMAVDGAKPTDRCAHCSGALFNKPILGLPILYHMKNEKQNYYTDGKIFDPTSGRFYSCNMTLKNGGNQLLVRGYIGFSLLGRSQTWYRVKQSSHKDSKWIRV